MNSKNVVLGNIDRINSADSVGKQNGLYREKDGHDYFYLFNKAFLPLIRARQVWR